MDLMQAVYVLEAARCGSLSQAAKRLFTSQPTLSQRIKRLEQELGCQLFSRTPQGVHLTEAGEAFCRKAQPVVEGWRELCGWASERSHAAPKRLRIGLGVRVYSSGLFEEIVHFFDLHPDIEAAFVTEAGRDFLPALKDGTLDLVLDRLPPEELGSGLDGLVMQDLICEDQCVLTSWDDPLSRLDSISLAQLQGCTMISSLAGSMEDRALKALCAKSGITLKRIYRSDSIDMIMDLVRKGKGVTIGPRSFASYYGVSSVIIRPQTSVYIKFICLDQGRLRKEIVQLRQYLQAVCHARGTAAAGP